MKIPDRNRAPTSLALRKNIIHPLSGLAFVTLLATLFFPLFGRLGVDYEPFDWICLPNGQALAPRVLRTQLYGTKQPYSMSWNPDLILSPTMRWGHLTFATAKAIDIAWDLLAGRLGQFALVFYMCPVLQRVMMQRMETAVVPLDLYSSLTIDRVSPWFIWTLWRQGRAKNLAGRAIGSRVAGLSVGTISSMLYIACYILGFQTILSVATSYQARKVAAVQDLVSGNGLVDISALRIPGLVVRNGSRVGLDDNAALCFSEDKADELCDLFFGYASAIASLSSPQTNETGPTGQIIDRGANNNGRWAIWLVPATTSASARYRSTITISNTTYDLSPSSLNIEFVTQPAGSPDPIFKDAATAWIGAERTLPYLALGDALLDLPSAERLVECIPSEHYEWGFSFLLLFIFMVLTILFLAVLAWLQLNLHWYSRVDAVRPTLSQYCDILAMARELRAELGEAVEDMTYEEMRELIERKVDVGMGVEVDGLPISRKKQRKQARMGDGVSFEVAGRRDRDHDMATLMRKTGAVCSRELE